MTDSQGAREPLSQIRRSIGEFSCTGGKVSRSDDGRSRKPLEFLDTEAALVATPLLMIPAKDRREGETNVQDD